MSTRLVAALAVTVVGAAGCAESPTEIEWQVIEELTFAPSLGIDLSLMERLPSGVYIRDLVVGTGAEVASTATVGVAYTGWLADGTQFDASPPGDTVAFPLVELIPGFRDGVTGMLEGGKRQLIIPPDQGYGARSIGTIPGGSVLVFEVEVFLILSSGLESPGSAQITRMSDTHHEDPHRGPTGRDRPDSRAHPLDRRVLD